MMPPDYWSALPDHNFLTIVVFLLRFYLTMFIFMALNIVFMIGSVWGLLIVFRLLGIPWLDGTTKEYEVKNLDGTIRIEKVSYIKDIQQMAKDAKKALEKV